MIDVVFDRTTWLRYWRRAVFLSAFLRFVPFVRLVGLNGSMVTGTFRQKSDIDLYIVTEPGHIFLSRFLATTLIELTGLRIKPGREAGRFCPNRFAVSSFTEITPHDAYHARVFHNLIPLYADLTVYDAYCAANRWMHDLGEPLKRHMPVLRPRPVSRAVQATLEWLVASPRLEQVVKRWQERRIRQSPEAQLPGSNVCISDQELRFHLPK